MTDFQWFALTLKQRKALLRQAGYAPNAWAYRCLSKLPSNIRVDVLYVYSLKVA